MAWLLGHQPPRLPTAHDIEDSIENLTVRPGARAAPRSLGLGEEWCEAGPLVIIEIGRVGLSGFCFHLLSLSDPFSKRSLRQEPVRG